MPIKETSMRMAYVAADYVSTLVAVVAFTLTRYVMVPMLTSRYPDAFAFLHSRGVCETLLFFPPAMLVLYYLAGSYVRVYNKSRIKETLSTAVCALMGAAVYFMAVLLNDTEGLSRRFNYLLLLLFAAVLFLCLLGSRMAILARLKYKQRHPGFGMNGVLVASPGLTQGQIAHMCSLAQQHGISLTHIISPSAETPLPQCAGLKQLPASMLGEAQADCAVIAHFTDNDTRLLDTIESLLAANLRIFLTPSLHDIVMGTVSYTSILNDPLVEITRPDLPDNVFAIKRALDVTVSALCLTVSLPLMAVLAIVIKVQSPGPVIYRQERLGYLKRPFTLFKLRTMHCDAEPHGPQLSQGDADPRVFKAGRFMRRYRLDEVPNLWNVLRGDMSLVGPRPERSHYVDLIRKRAPHYSLIHQVRPGLTSWGMVRYGYASDIDGMVRRLNFDLMYLRNISLALDMRILYFTIFTVLKGEGK